MWGWKTVLGSVLFGASYLVDGFGLVPGLGDGLRALGAAVGGIGLAHKFVKMEREL